ncbi:amino acid ABC transporter permease [Aquabacter spiritensis]|uniref:Amino acid ABC transporter membrane protein 2 (PAAT family) n=1 Tax=Aquabacter spiritensis TaxID=933073 RepID=A0A4R3LV20_9HYPH|nr:amino acid ABC transporter permease [Aquabacter spiritensis]TCT04391.1 amino acid ABC transporter membrane protein 2 (PAAT family) [Aquabacter spiritensis]
MSAPPPRRLEPSEAGAPLAVLLPFRPPPPAAFAWPRLRLVHLVGIAGLVLVVGGAAHAQASGARLSALEVIWRWLPLLMWGFGFNILMSVLSMALGTAAGLGLGLLQIGENRLLRRVAWAATQFFRNSPWLVLLFFAMFMIPFQFTVFGHTMPLPDWVKAVIGFSLPVMANMSEIVRGAVASLPSGQWEAAESLAFSRRQTMWRIILPQCVKRMLPPWMNLYSLITMATVQASIVGVSEMLTLTSQVHAAEGGRPDLLAPLYGFAMLCFFLYCYPIERFTLYLERRFQLNQ